MTKSMHIALEDLKLERIFTVYPGKEAYPMHERVEALPLAQLHERMEKIGGGVAVKPKRAIKPKAGRRK